jgi:hypothetical protein
MKVSKSQDLRDAMRLGFAVMLALWVAGCTTIVETTTVTGPARPSPPSGFGEYIIVTPSGENDCTVHWRAVAHARRPGIAAAVGLWDMNDPGNSRISFGGPWRREIAEAEIHVSGTNYSSGGREVYKHWWFDGTLSARVRPGHPVILFGAVLGAAPMPSRLDVHPTAVPPQWLPSWTREGRVHDLVVDCEGTQSQRTSLASVSFLDFGRGDRLAELSVYAMTLTPDADVSIQATGTVSMAGRQVLMLGYLARDQPQIGTLTIRDPAGHERSWEMHAGTALAGPGNVIVHAGPPGDYAYSLNWAGAGLADLRVGVFGLAEG